MLALYCVYTEYVNRAVESCRLHLSRSVTLTCILMYTSTYAFNDSHTVVYISGQTYICLYILDTTCTTHTYYNMHLYATGRLGSLAVFQAEFCDPIRAGGFAGANVLKVCIHLYL